MLIINPYIFKQFSEITFGFSTRIGLQRNKPYYFNMSYTVGDEPDKVNENRITFFKQLGLDTESVAYQKQVHSDKIIFVNAGGDSGKSDAMITDKNNIGLAISTADCCAVFIYDPVKKVLAGVHSGWRGTSKEILLKVLQKLSNEFDSAPGDLICYLSPSISDTNYEVGVEVAEQFDLNYLKQDNGKYLLDIPKINEDLLLNYGVIPQNIQISNLCSYEYSSILHSYRRDGKKSGRALGVIAMRGGE
jgi:YfiH family protein